MSQPIATILLHPDMEELEMIAPADILRRAGVKVILATLSATDSAPDESVRSIVRGKHGIEILADRTLKTLTDNKADMLIIPGGPGVHALRQDARAIDGLQAFAKEGKWIGCICAAPLLLHDAGLLPANRRFTAHASTHETLVGVEKDVDVVLDGRFITASGAGASISFGLTLSACLKGATESRKIARAIAYSGSFPNQ